jgi:hypothetical protein
MLHKNAGNAAHDHTVQSPKSWININNEIP